MIKKTKIKLKDIKPIKKNIIWSYKQLDMIEGVSNNYDENISLIWVTKDNEIIDGHHRFKILSEKYNGDYEITVKKFNFSKKIYGVILFICLPIYFLILLPLYLFFLLPFKLIKVIFKFFNWVSKKKQKKFQKRLDKTKRKS